MNKKKALQPPFKSCIKHSVIIFQKLKSYSGKGKAICLELGPGVTSSDRLNSLYLHHQYFESLYSSFSRSSEVALIWTKSVSFFCFLGGGIQYFTSENLNWMMFCWYLSFSPQWVPLITLLGWHCPGLPYIIIHGSTDINYG